MINSIPIPAFYFLIHISKNFACSPTTLIWLWKRYLVGLTSYIGLVIFIVLFQEFDIIQVKVICIQHSNETDVWKLQ